MNRFRNIIAIILFSYAFNAQASERLEFVNQRPQFNVTEKFFAMYIGIWRGFSESEKSLIPSGATLLSQRKVQWQVRKCEDNTIEHQDRDVHWAIDELALDEDGNVLPIIEANRPNYRYFSLINLHGLFLRGTGDLKRSQRLPEETHDAFTARLAKEKEDWWNRASPKGTRGAVDISLTMKLVVGLSKDIIEEQFIRFENYKVIATDSPAMKELFIRTAPNRWPVSYDERAHKPHSFSEPAAWRSPSTELISSDEIRARLEWDWCNRETAPIARVVFPKGKLPAPGPNRAGRTDHGPATIEVVEQDLLNWSLHVDLRTLSFKSASASNSHQ
jgi:hypothetical protein